MRNLKIALIVFAFVASLNLNYQKNYSNEFVSHHVTLKEHFIGRKLEATNNVESSRQALRSVRHRMMFGTNLNDFRDIINNLPDGYYDFPYILFCIPKLI